MFIVQLLVVLAACLLDLLLGEPRRWHPLVGFGWVASKVEASLNRAGAGRLAGLAALLLLVMPPTLAATALTYGLLAWSQASGGPLGQVVYLLCAAGVLYWALGWRSLVVHVRAVATALRAKDLLLARTQVGRIVSRDCERLSALQVRRAAIESALENTSDAIVAPLFWFLVAGLPGVVLYRLTNTLDAMWGYKTPRYLKFGWAAARWDDVLNWLPARLTALGFALFGHTGSALHAWGRQAALCASPNAGAVMCAGAGALRLRLGGPAIYAGQGQCKPWMGMGFAPENGDIESALDLVRRTVLGGLLVWALVSAAYHGYNASL